MDNKLFTSAGITDSPAFKAWFGNSVVVDAAGNPLTVFKGMLKNNWRTGEEIKIIDSPNGPWAGFFTSDEQVANNFRSAFTGMGEAVTHAVYLRIENPYMVDAKGGAAKDFMFDNTVFGKPAKNAEALQAFSQGFDGVIIKNTGDEGDIYVPKNSEQIKSVNNVGEFDVSNPDITAALHMLATYQEQMVELAASEPLEIDNRVYDAPDLITSLKTAIRLHKLIVEH